MIFLMQFILPFLFIFSFGLIYSLLRKKNVHIWLGSYIIQNLNKKKFLTLKKPVHILFCFVDHFEPYWNKASKKIANERMNQWIMHYPEIARQYQDNYGNCPKHTFFYPEEQYQKDDIDRLSELCKMGFAEIEVHLHHNNDNSEDLKKKLENYKVQLASHGLLSRDKNGNIRYGFIHGNWALDNSRKNGRLCGVNNELLVLKETGCYADFTFPSAPDETQTRKINSIYYATDDPAAPKSHNTGIDVEVGRSPSGDLMIIQGSLALNWQKRRWFVFPSIENGEVSFDNPPFPGRISLWATQYIHVKGRPDWIFIKVHTHGAQEDNIDFFFKKGAMKNLFDYLKNRYMDGYNYALHYLTAREFYNIIKAAEAEEEGNPEDYKDYELII